MSTITLKKLSLLNFKGIKNLVIDFDANTNIYGDNGTGKTSIFDAFTWLLFGKDSSDRKDFQVKTLDSENNVIPKIEHEVSAELGVNGDVISVKRILKEKWVKTKGALEAEFSGNETLYYWNDVPLSMKEFGNKVSEILDEQVFKLITSPTAFNSLKWQDKRNVLIKVAGDISDQELAKGNADYLALLSQLTNKTLDEYKKQIAATIKKAKDDIKAIPTRIDEVERSKPQAVDSAFINAEISKKQSLLDDIDRKIADKSSANADLIQKKTDNQNQIFALKSRKNSLVFQITENAKAELTKSTSKADNIRAQILKKDSEELVPGQQKLNRLSAEKNALTQAISVYEKSMQEKRELWNAENAKVFIFSDNTPVCPCCNRALDAEAVEESRKELQANFNTNKKQLLDEINAQGKAIKEKKENAEVELQELNGRIASGETYIKGVEAEIVELRESLKNAESETTEKPSLDLVVEVMLAENDEYQTIVTDIKNLEELKFETPEQDNSYAQEKADLNKAIQELRDSLKSNDLIATADNRIKELQDEESKLAQSIADIEKTQYTIENFIKLKIDTVEDKINTKFDYVKFKLFDKQINGALVECCEALINGVPFSDANTASKINAGIDIINTLCDYYNVSAPIFIDNRESVVKLLDSNSQIINLFVSPEDKKIRIA